MYFLYIPNILVPFSTTSTEYTDFIFCSNLVSTPKPFNTKIENFPFNPSPSGAPYKVFNLLLNTQILTVVQMQMNTFLHPSPDPEYPPTQKQCNTD